MINFISKLFSGSGSNIIESVGNVVDKFVTTKEEKEAIKLEIAKEINRNLEAMQDKANAEFELVVKDLESARNANIQLQTSEKVPILIKFTSYIIDLFVALIWGGMTVYVIGTMLSIIKRDPSVNFEGVLGIYTAITGIFMIERNFNRGSSKSSEDKQKTIERMMGK